MRYAPMTRRRRPLRHRVLAALAAIGLLVAAAACTGESASKLSADTSSSMSVPPPDPETSAPAPAADYQEAIVEFCAAAGQTRSDLHAIANVVPVDFDTLIKVAEGFHDSFAALYAAHQNQFDGELNGSEPLDTGFALDAALAMLVDQAQSADTPTLSPTDPIFIQFSDLATECGAQGAPMP